MAENVLASEIQVLAPLKVAPDATVNVPLSVISLLLLKLTVPLLINGIFLAVGLAAFVMLLRRRRAVAAVPSPA